jgi:hypothetical protein
MTLSEAKDILIDRIGWKDDNTVKGVVLSANNLLSNSGRYFQDEHSAITLANIRDCQPIPNILNDDFNDYLYNLKKSVSLKVLSDVFEKDYVDDNLFTIYPTVFDEVISLRMVIDVSEILMTSTRSNSIERFTKDFIGKLNYDIYREAPNKFAIRDLNYKHTLGIATRYAFALKSVQRRFGSQKNLLKVITKGAVFNPYFPYFDE